MEWLSVAGERHACFHALGQHASASIRTILDTLPQLDALRRHVATPVGQARLDAVVEATATRFPLHLAEIAALAAGAGVDAETLQLLNLRGDFGDPRAGGCSDIAVAGDRWVLGHNEDGDPRFAEGISGLTLDIDGARPLFALWYPGMLPSNAFTLNAGLAWGIDHVPAAAATPGPARHIVARALQEVETLDGAEEFLACVPSAGGFAYNFVERATGRAATVESGGGADGRAHASGIASMLWHTNHLRYPTATGATPPPSSCARGDLLAVLASGTGGRGLDSDRVLEILTTPLPDGVRAEGQSVTLCTVVVDGAADSATFVPRGGEPEHVGMAELLTA
jgi:Acyl-coenzyme A:6-aminopenicillanic acid acyl-transferase